MEYKGTINDKLELLDITSENCFILKQKEESTLTIFWNTEAPSRFKIDGKETTLQQNQVLFLTEFHQLEVLEIGKGKLVRFNRSFYCISDHDNEVGCRGILFFGATQTPIICIENSELEKFQILWKMFMIEMVSNDKLQTEMLQMMLKRLIILCTRLYKEQHTKTKDSNGEYDIVREFNFLVETNYKKLHKVADYAELMYKSPKTLSNLFAKYHDKSPLQIIKDRKMIEAKRLLRYSQLQVSEIAHQIGYDDVHTFSRFFKSQEKKSPTEYREILNLREKMPKVREKM